MREKVYAIVYDRKGQFIVAKKNEKSYFFDWQPKDKGQTLKGDLDFAFPGGWKKESKLSSKGLCGN